MKHLTSPRPPQSGSVLVLVVVSLVVLTFVGVAATQGAQFGSRSQGDWLRNALGRQAALTGLEHARVELSDPNLDVAELSRRAATSETGCFQWIGEGADVEPHDLAANARSLGDYRMRICRPLCTTTTPGNQLNASDAGQVTMRFAFDVSADGDVRGETRRTNGGMLAGERTGEGCDGL